MAYQENLRTLSYPVAADSSTYQYLFCKMNSSGQAALCGDGEAGIGVFQDNDATAAGRPSCIGIEGVSKVKAGGAIDEGDYVASDASGKAVKAATGDFILGRCVLQVTADGQYTSVQLGTAAKLT